MWRTEEIPALRGGHTAAGLSDPRPARPSELPGLQGSPGGLSTDHSHVWRVRGHMLERGSGQGHTRLGARPGEDTRGE